MTVAGGVSFFASYYLLSWFLQAGYQKRILRTIDKYIKRGIIKEKLGHETDIFYDPANPTHVRLDPPKNYTIVGILMVVGILLIYSGKYGLSKPGQ